MIAYTTAPPDYDYPCVTRTGVSYSAHGATWHQVRVTDIERWNTFQVPRYRSGWFAVADTPQLLQLWGLPGEADK